MGRVGFLRDKNSSVRIFFVLFRNFKLSHKHEFKDRPEGVERDVKKKLSVPTQSYAKKVGSVYNYFARGMN